jgi:Na+-driven multidrug efflux pump
MGLQKKASYMTIACIYILGIPSACIFAFVLDWGVLGLEAGFGVACLALAICYISLLRKTDW